MVSPENSLFLWFIVLALLGSALAVEVIIIAQRQLDGQRKRTPNWSHGGLMLILIVGLGYALTQISLQLISLLNGGLKGG